MDNAQKNIFLKFQATTFGVEPHTYNDNLGFPVWDQSTHEKSFNQRTTSSLISIVIRPELATSGNLRVKCVVSLLTLYHRSNEISVETIGLVQPKLKTSRHLPPTMVNDETRSVDYHNIFKNTQGYMLDGANADKFARVQMSSGTISRYKFVNILYYTIALFLGCYF